MKTIHLRLFLATLLPAFIVACDGDGVISKEHDDSGDTPTNRVDIPATVRSNLAITFAKVERRNVADTIRVPGSFELQPLARHEYSLMLPGRVQLEVDQFDTVEPGTLLFRFRSPQWREIQAQIDLARAGLDHAKAKHEAAETRIAALKQADFKRADLEAEIAVLRADMAKQDAELQAALSNATKILNLHRPQGDASLTPDELLAPANTGEQSATRYRSIDWISVHATEKGVVESLAVTDGSFVEEATLVLTTVDPSKIRFRALGLQSDLPKFADGQSVRIVPPQGSSSELNESVEGSLAIGVVADPGHRTVTLFAVPKEARSWTRPGVSAFLEITTEDTGGVALAIPRSAVVKDGITHVFFKRDPLDANKAIRVEADLGVDDGRWVEVKSGVGPNDVVVLDGAYELKLATSQSGTSQKGGHFHADGTYHAEED